MPGNLKYLSQPRRIWNAILTRPIMHGTKWTSKYQKRLISHGSCFYYPHLSIGRRTYMHAINLLKTDIIIPHGLRSAKHLQTHQLRLEQPAVPIAHTEIRTWPICLLHFHPLAGENQTKVTSRDSIRIVLLQGACTYVFNSAGLLYAMIHRRIRALLLVLSKGSRALQSPVFSALQKLCSILSFAA